MMGSLETPRPKPIAFFDVDYTLCAGYTGYFTTRELIRHHIIKKRHLLAAVTYSLVGHLFKQMDVRRMYRIALSDMAGTRVEDIMELGRQIFEKYLKPRLYEEGLEEIQRRKDQGYLIAILSSGPTMAIKNMVGFLGADVSFSNGPAIREGILQAEIQEPLCYKEGKVEVARSFSKKQGVELKDCAFYSDGYSDLPLLSQVGEPVVVNPDRNLRRVAIQRGWRQLQFKRTLGNSSRSSS
jgi:HAD superfamily hydrolase (TIGR01490 family)